jgi:hypothetical protein
MVVEEWRIQRDLSAAVADDQDTRGVVAGSVVG